MNQTRTSLAFRQGVTGRVKDMSCSQSAKHHAISADDRSEHRRGWLAMDEFLIMHKAADFYGVLS